MRQIVLNALLPKRHRTLKEDMFIFAMPPELKMVLVYCSGLYCVAGWVRDEAGEVLWTCKTEPQFWMLIPEVE